MISPKAFLAALVLAGIVGCTAQGSVTPIQSSAPGTTPTAAPTTTPMPAMSGMSDMPTAGPTATAGPAAMTQSVTIKNFAFSPANITVMRGGTVTWTNQDSIGHSATSDTAGVFDTGIIATGGTSSPVTFNTAGTFTYHCSVHPNMHGTITVQ